MQEMVKRILETVLKTREQAKTLREIRETIEITLETIKYEVVEEKQLEQVLKEITKIITRTSCNIIKHPNTTPNYILNTPNIKIQQTLLMRTIACTNNIAEISTTFKVETIEIQTPDKKYVIITNVKEVKPSH